MTASLGGNEVAADAWALDAATAGLRSAWGGPSGTAPATFSARAVEVVTGRRHVEAGLREDRDEPARVRIGSNYFDLAMVFDYWGSRRLNHHTEATTALYGARECAALLVEEGMKQAVERHRLHGGAMAAGVAGLGLELFGDQAHRMNNVVGVEIPDGVDDARVRAQLLDGFGIEIGTSFGPLKGRIWRIGTMGYNARKDAVLSHARSPRTGTAPVRVRLAAGSGVGAAYEIYQEAP